MTNEEIMQAYCNSTPQIPEKLKTALIEQAKKDDQKRGIESKIVKVPCPTCDGKGYLEINEKD